MLRFPAGHVQVDQADKQIGFEPDLEFEDSF